VTSATGPRCVSLSGLTIALMLVICPNSLIEDYQHPIRQNSSPGCDTSEHPGWKADARVSMRGNVRIPTVTKDPHRGRDATAADGVCIQRRTTPTHDCRRGRSNGTSGVPHRLQGGHGTPEAL
jgi:hypothetical protein